MYLTRRLNHFNYKNLRRTCVSNQDYYEKTIVVWITIVFDNLDGNQKYTEYCIGAKPRFSLSGERRHGISSSANKFRWCVRKNHRNGRKFVTKVVFGVSIFYKGCETFFSRPSTINPAVFENYGNRRQDLEKKKEQSQPQDRLRYSWAHHRHHQ